MDKNKGYPLPAVALTEDMVCQLVYYPNKPEYRRALLGSLAYLATWIAWEKEATHKGKDAAISWKNALDLTMECWEMACLEQLESDVSAILALMQIPQSCCDAGDVTDGDQYTDRVTDGVGNVPQNIIDAGYASGTSDWAGFDDYKCMIAHVLVDQLTARLNELAPLIDNTGAILGGVAAVAGILAVIFATGGVAVVFGIVAGIGATSLLYQAISDFGVVESLVTKITTNHDELVCSIYNSDGDAGALTDLNTKIDELFTAPEALILKNLNLGPTLKALYAGRYDQQDIADTLFDAGYSLVDFTCDCDQVGEYSFTYDFTADAQSWNLTNGAIRMVGQGNPTPSIRLPGNQAALAFITAGNLRAEVGLSSPTDLVYVDIHRIIVDWAMTGAAYTSIDMYTQNSLATNHETLEYSLQPTYLTREYVFSPPLHCVRTKRVVALQKLVATSNYALIDNIYIDFDAGTD